MAAAVHPTANSTTSTESMASSSTTSRSDSISTSSATIGSKPAASDARKLALKGDIERAIAKYKHNGSKPPFSHAEVLVMAILCHDHEFVSRAEIYQWIVDNFASYRHQAISLVVSAAANDFEIETIRIFGDAKDTFLNYDIPLSISEYEAAKSLSLLNFAPQQPQTVNVPLDSGRLFLRNVLEAPRKGVFPMLQLPPELRIRIYEMVFSFPDIGITKDCLGVQAFCVWQREHEVLKFNNSIAQRSKVDFPLHSNSLDHYGCVVTRPVQSILALLSVNKQIYNEALPYFFRINHFRFASEQCLTSIVNYVVPARMQHVQHLSFPYTSRITEWNPAPPDVTFPEYFKNALQILTLHKAVKDLEIVADDADWLYGKQTWGGWQNSIYSGPEELPCIQELARLVGVVEQVSFRGNCPKIEEYVRAQARVTVRCLLSEGREALMEC